MTFSPKLVLSALVKAQYAWLTSCDVAADVSCVFQHICVPGLSVGLRDTAWEQSHLGLSAPNSIPSYAFSMRCEKNHQVTISRTLDYYFQGRLHLGDKLSVSPNFTHHHLHSVHLYGFVWVYYLCSTALLIFISAKKKKKAKATRWLRMISRQYYKG